MRTYDIYGIRVQCHEHAGVRIWICPCADFERRAKASREGYCAHTALALERSIDQEAVSIPLMDCEGN